jgi:hypothetical protein
VDLNIYVVGFTNITQPLLSMPLKTEIKVKKKIYSPKMGRLIINNIQYDISIDVYNTYFIITVTY